MSQMKRFAEQVSIEMGFNGELNDEVLEEAQRRLQSNDSALAHQAVSEYGEEQCLKQAGDF